MLITGDVIELGPERSLETIFLYTMPLWPLLRRRIAANIEGRIAANIESTFFTKT